MSGASAAGEPAPLDGPQLWAQVGEDPALLREVIQIFFEDLPATTGALEDAVRRGDSSGIFQGAHRIKGSLLNLAAAPSVDEARSLEALAQAGKVMEAREHLAALKRELSRLRTALEEISVRGTPLPSPVTELSAAP